MSNNTQVAPFEAARQPKKPETIASLLGEDRYKKRFEQVLGERAPQFISSILSLGATMHDVEPRSVLASAAIAASLNLPVNPTLGFAWIVPYKKNGVKFGQFQCGYKGLIQLAQRTGAYRSMNAEAVNAEVYKGRNKVGEPVIDWEALDETKPVAGYVFAFEMINGFEKVCYWSKEKVERHAQRYSQAYRGGYDTPWKTDFDRMALKTVVANELRRWGMLSVELQGAFAEDHAIHRDIDAPAEFPDAADEITRPKFDDEKAEAAAGLAPAEAPKTAPAAEAPKSEAPKRGRKKTEEAAPVQQSPTPSPTEHRPATETGARIETPDCVSSGLGGQTPPASNTGAGGDLLTTPYRSLQDLMTHSQVTEPELIVVCKQRGLMEPTQEELRQLADAKLADLAEMWPAVAGQVRINRRSGSTAGQVVRGLECTKGGKQLTTGLSHARKTDENKS